MCSGREGLNTFLSLSEHSWPTMALGSSYTLLNTRLTSYPSRFRQSLTLAEWDERMDLRYTLDMIWLVERLQQCAGIKLGLRVQREVSRVWSQDIIPGSIGLMDGICVLDSDIEKFGGRRMVSFSSFMI